MPDAGQTRAYLALTLIATLWGSYPAFAKLALAHFPPYVLVALRCALASAFLTVLLFRRGWDEFRELRAADLRTFAFLGFVGLFVSTGGTYLGIALSTAANAAILQAATPIMVALGARFYLGERLRRRQWAGVASSLAGVLLVITRGSWRALTHLELLPGDFVLMISLAGWAAYTIYGKQVLTVHSPAVATTASYILGSAMLLPMALVTAPFFPRPDFTSETAWLVVFYQAILGAVAHVWWYEGVKAVGPSRAAVFLNLQPIVGVLLAWAMVGETIEWPEIVGGALVLLGVALTTRAPATSPGPRPTAAS
ncbi:MAG TPA: DMT family transporter [Methylomirabilota bacterium]|nr:DMT family transporter [Methylomirabilota bacterium]